MKTLLCLLFTAVGLLNLQAAEDAPADSFAVGKVWFGNRTFENDKGKVTKRGLDMTLKIGERTGEDFKGVILVSSSAAKNIEVPVTGKATATGDGSVKFESEKKGEFQQMFFGRLKNGALDLDFRGKNANGEFVQGKAVLTPKK